MPAKNRAHYRGDYARRARAVRQAAYGNPEYRCWRCGELARSGDPWEAGHLRDADPTSPLLAEHKSCNSLAGNRIQEPRSQRW